jgi:hypothetical protein
MTLGVPEHEQRKSRIDRHGNQEPGRSDTR